MNGEMIHKHLQKELEQQSQCLGKAGEDRLPAGAEWVIHD